MRRQFNAPVDKFGFIAEMNTQRKGGGRIGGRGCDGVMTAIMTTCLIGDLRHDLL